VSIAAVAGAPVSIATVSMAPVQIPPPVVTMAQQTLAVEGMFMILHLVAGCKTVMAHENIRNLGWRCGLKL
jgi:hypothetical protein